RGGSSSMKEAGFISPVGRGMPIDAPICCKSEALSKKIVSPQRSSALKCQTTIARMRTGFPVAGHPKKVPRWVPRHSFSVTTQDSSADRMRRTRTVKSGNPSQCLQPISHSCRVLLRRNVRMSTSGPVSALSRLLPVYFDEQTFVVSGGMSQTCQQLTFVLICVSLRKPRDDLVNIRFWEHLDRGRPHVPQGGQRQEKLGHGLIVGGLGVDDEVICSHGEI